MKAALLHGDKVVAINDYINGSTYIRPDNTNQQTEVVKPSFIDDDLIDYLSSVSKHDRINPLYSILSLEVAKIVQVIVKGTNLDIDQCCNSVIALVNNADYNIDNCDKTVFVLLITNKIYKIALSAQNQNNIDFTNYISESKAKLKKIVNYIYTIYNYKE